MFHVIFGIPWLIVAVRFILPLPWGWGLKLILAAVLLAGSQYHWFSRLSSGSVFSPEFPRPLVITFNLVFGALIFLAIFQILLDVASLGLMALHGRFPAVPAGVRYGMGVAAILLAALAVRNATVVPPVKDVEIAIPNLPPAFEGYRLIQLTDLHISRLFQRRWAQAVVDKTNALGADLIVVTGDFIDGSLSDRREDVAPLSDLRAPDGVYAVTGNHEYFFSPDAWIRHFEGQGIRMLLNRHVVLSRGADRLVIAGVTDRSAGRSGTGGPDLAAALSGVPDQAPVILLDHQPMDAARNAQSGVVLQLSGHTHGGMLFGLDRIVARANNGFVSGLYHVGAMQLYVNNGTGLWPGFALRLGVPAELTRITLRRA